MSILLKEAILILKRGGVVGYPTETVYGIGSRIDNPGAIYRLKKLTGRDRKKPLLVAFPSVSVAAKYVFLSEKEKKFLRKIMPGPISVIVKSRPGKIPKSITNGGDFVGIRIPENSTARRLASSIGAIISTSANLSGDRPVLSADEAEKRLGIFSVVSGKCKYKKASTLIELSTGKILKEGAYPKKRLLRKWKEAFS